MNSELQKLRRHYGSLPPHVKARTTAQSLLKAIQIAGLYEAALVTIRDSACGELQCKKEAMIALSQFARVTKEVE